MYTLESLPLIHVWLDADHLASTARIIMDGHRVNALGVTDRDRLLKGWITLAELAGVDDDVRVGTIAVQPPLILDSSLTIREAADELIQTESDYLPVIREGKFYAIVSARDLLSKLRESYDPMTELPWNDALRAWGKEHLEHNEEVTVLFIDINNFAKFNKTYGHVVGDRVIQSVATHLKTKVDPKRDILVRYGGDEFAIGTIRNRYEAEDLMSSLTSDWNGFEVPGVDEPSSFTVGIYGGQRVKARNNVHGASNIDDLVNNASRDCLERKVGFGRAVIEVSSEPVEQAPIIESPSDPVFVTSGNAPSEPDGHTATQATVVGRPTLSIATIDAPDDPSSITYVVIESGSGALSVGVSPKMGSSRVESIAMATAKAIEKAIPNSRISIESVKVTRAGATELVTAQVKAVRDGIEREVTAEAEANGDLDETIGLVVISAFLAE